MVYVELIIITDLFINYLILISVGIILNRITSIKKVFLSSVIGCIPIIFLYLDISNISLVIINFLFSIIMSIITYSYQNLLYTTKNIIYMYFVSIFLAGSIYLIETTFIKIFSIPLLSLIIMLFLSPIITYFYIKCLKKIKNINSNYYYLDIYLKDFPPITLTAYLDTGNKLVDPYKGYPIALVAKSTIPLRNIKTILVPYNTIDSHGMLECFKPEKIYIHNVGYRKKVMLGLINKVSIEGADCILNQKLLERI